MTIRTHSYYPFYGDHSSEPAEWLEDDDGKLRVSGGTYNSDIAFYGSTIDVKEEYGFHINDLALAGAIADWAISNRDRLQRVEMNKGGI